MLFVNVKGCLRYDFLSGAPLGDVFHGICAVFIIEGGLELHKKTTVAAIF